MKKLIIILCLALTVLPVVLALNLDVEQKTSNAVMIPVLDNPVLIDIEVTNNGPKQSIEIYNLLGFRMTPNEQILLESGEKKDIGLIIFPRHNFEHRGYYTLNYFIRGTDNTEIEESVTFKSLDLEDAFGIGANEIDPESNSITIFIENKENYNFGQMEVNFNSPFFDLSKQISLGPNEREEFQIELNKEDFKDLLAGFYTLSADLTIQEKTTTVEGAIEFSEKDILDITQRDYGFLIHTEVVEKENNGNIVTESRTVVEKNIISRLFTSFTPEPDFVEREGSRVTYIWENQIEPGNTLRITTKTNWLLPLFIILFVIAIVILAKQYKKTNLDLKKHVSFVRTKGGEFALKVTINVNARQFVERVTITERLPPLVKLYERFGSEKPNRIDEKNKRVEWNFDQLDAGETRVLSYVIYSKVGIVGKFALPTATAVYETNGKIHETESNRTFFVIEQSVEKNN